MNKKLMSNLLWRYAERCGAQIVQFTVSIVLARIIVPEAFGSISIVLVFTNILQVFVDSGIGNALIQNKDSDEVDFSSVFYFNIVWCVFLYFIAFFSAPFIANFYEDSQLTLVVRVLSILLIISGIKNVEQAYVSKTLQFKKFFFSTLGGTILSAIGGVWLAIAGYGVWALVAQKLINAFVDTVILYFTMGWRPRLLFSFVRIKKLFRYAWKLLLTSLLDFLYLDFQQLMIGKIYSASVLAYYSRGKQFPQIIVSNINTSIDSVLFPIMSFKQEDPEDVKRILRRAIKMSTYIMTPLMIGLVVTAPTVVSLLLTSKWIECVPFLRFFCITYMFQPILTSNMNAIKALGRSDILLKIEIIKKVFCIFILLGTLWISVEAILYGLLICSLFSQMVNAWPNKKLLGYGYLEQLKDIFSGISLALLMGCCIYPISLISLPSVLLLFLQIFVGGMLYIVISAIQKIESYLYLKSFVKSIINTHRK